MKLIVIDDEPIVPNALKKLIAWEQHGIEWIGAAENGTEALRLMERTLPDAILVDCRMPVMDGIELLREIKRRGWAVKSVVLSGHDEFEYAQQAMRLGASDYLLKPPRVEQLLEVMLRVKREWEEEQARQRQLKDNIALLRKQFMRRLVGGARYDDAAFAEQVDRLQLPIDASPYVIAILDVKEHPEYPKNYGFEDRQLMNYAITNITEEILQDWTSKYVMPEGEQRLVLFMNVPGEQALGELRSRFYRIIDSIGHTLRYQVTIGAAFSAAALNRTAAFTWERAQMTVKYQYYTGPGEVIFSHDLEKEAQRSGREGRQDDSRDLQLDGLSAALKKCDSKQLARWFEQFECDLKAAHMSAESAKTLALQAALRATETIVHIHPQYRHEQLLSQNVIRRIWSTTSVHQLIELLQNYVQHLFTLIADLRNSGKNMLVERTKRWIHQHYSENITLERLASEVYLSPAYLSFLFKQEEGLNLTEYVTEYRVAQAKQLLKQTVLRTYEVSAKVGYADEKYFSRLFKKKTGMTPTEYRRANA